MCANALFVSHNTQCPLFIFCSGKGSVMAAYTTEVVRDRCVVPRFEYTSDR